VITVTEDENQPLDENTKRPCGQACGEVVAVATEEKSRRALSAKKSLAGVHMNWCPLPFVSAASPTRRLV
jgi:hypothetical protein